jgi:membrane fusion protein, multidrug efflux system
MPPPQVVVYEAKAERVVETLPVVANVQANEMVEIKAETDGIVSEILFEEGQPVKKGHVLVHLDDTKFAATLAQTEANFKLSASSFERARQLFEDKLISQQEYDQAQAVYQANQATLEYARRQLKDARIIAPFDGVIGAKTISPGQVISKNQVLTWLIDLDPVKVEFQLPEKFLGEVKPKQRIEMGVSAFAQERFSGEVFFVSPFVDPTNRTALVKAYIPNPDHKLRPGMFANMDLTLTVRENSVVIPELALTQILAGNKAQLFVVDNTGTAQMRTVDTGVRQLGTVEVLKGVAAGEKVIVEGLQKVIPGVKVRTAMPAPAAVGGAAPAQPKADEKKGGKPS